MHQYIQKLIAAFSVITVAAVLASCGGGGGGSDDSSQVQGKGTVGILLTDMPADPAQFAAIIASIRKVELMGSEENGRITLYSGPVKEFDLLRLRNESIPLVFKDNVPAGSYCKIRLTLSDLELILTDDTPNDLSNNDTDHPKLPGNGKLDLVARDCFTVVDKEVLTLQLDIDAGKSIHIVGNPNCSNNPNKGCFNFRPVIFVDVVDKDFDSKLVRLNGEITAIDKDRQSLLLCDAVPSETMKNLGCVNVDFGADSTFFGDSAFFDNVTWEGAPRPINELLSDDKLKMNLTVVGRVTSWNSADNDADKPAEYYPLLQLEALVAELGKFLQIEGTVAVDADMDGFAMTVSSGSPVIVENTLDVMFQPGGTGFNGTRIVSKSGILLNPIDVREPLPIQVDGVLQLQSIDPWLKAALVIIDKSAETEQVTGTILSVGTDSLILAPEASTVCGVATSQLMVDLTSDADILTVTITNTSSEIAPGGTLQADQSVGMNGTCEVTGYQTDNVVIVDDQRN